MQSKELKPLKVLIMVDSIVVVGALTRCALRHSVWDLKAAQINMQGSLIWEFMLYKFRLGHNVAEATKNILRPK